MPDRSVLWTPLNSSALVKMASEGFLVMVMLTNVVLSSADFVSLKCQNSVGLVGQPSRLQCILKTAESLEKSPEITHVFWKYNNKVVLKMANGAKIGEERFKFADASWKKTMDISLLIDSTKISDQGQYSCVVSTNMGITGPVDVTLNVKAEYSEPVTAYKLNKDETRADMNCTAKGGYPQGAIHWFDSINTNWTGSSQTTATKMEDGSFVLQSTYTSNDVSLAPFRCVVFNSDWKEEHFVDIEIPIRVAPDKMISGVETKHIAAAVVVIGSLICGLLIALLLFRRRSRRHDDRYDDYPPDIEPEARAELTVDDGKDKVAVV
ncbi:CD276 antigen homolog isoform X2 [Engraulis encrasicolus]|uniref:CD276 antigen homolog isoform X2 n=1 Tax=Engraulis encrasicolus TaxID=184585 RepID=UPI002FD235EE